MSLIALSKFIPSQESSSNSLKSITPIKFKAPAIGSATISTTVPAASKASSMPSPAYLAAASVNFKSEKSLVRALQLNSFPSPKPKLPKNSSSSPFKTPKTPLARSNLSPSYLSSLSLCFTASAFFFLRSSLCFFCCSLALKYSSLFASSKSEWPNRLAIDASAILPSSVLLLALAFVHSFAPFFLV